jgi:flagellar hook-length control protein FliK
VDIPFSAALESQMGGSEAAPEAGQAMAQAAEKGEKAGQDSPIDGKDLPLAPDTDISFAAFVPVAPMAVNAAVPPNPNGTPTPVASSEPAPLADAGTNTANPAKAPGLIAEITADNEMAPPSEQEGEVLSEVDIFKAAMQGGNRSAFVLSSSSRGGLNMASSPTLSKAEASNDSTGMAAVAGSDDPLSAILDKIMPAREASSAANGQGISSAISATVRENAAPTQQQVLTQPFTDLMASSRGVTSHSTPVASAPVAVPFNQPGWDQALGERVHWLVTQRFQAAEIHLNPPELGPVEVRLALDRDQASVRFISPHASVREAIEAAMPRLREMLGESGIHLADVNVGQHSAERQSPFHPDFGASHHASAMWVPGAHGDDDAVMAAATASIPVPGLVDYYV